MVDQNSQFYAILTNVGAAKQANADALGIAWKITQMGVGDANDTEPTPNASQISLINEWRRAPLNQLKIDDKDNSIIVAEQVIPAEVGGRWIREIGLYDADGDLVAVANCPPTYKPLLNQGSGRTQVVRMNLVVSSSSNVELKIDPAVVLATREWVTSELHKQDFKHSVLAATTANIALTGLQTIDGVALSAGARVLVKNQAAGKDNGLYTVAAGAWTRCPDADSSAEVTPGLLVLVERGTVNGDSAWQLVTDAPITLGVSALVFEMAFGRTGVAENTYRSVTVDKYGRVVAATNPTTVAGYGLTDVYTKTQIDQSLALKAPLASPTFTGEPKAATPALFDASGKLATTEFVQRALGNYRFAIFNVSASRALTLDDIGATLATNSASNITLTLPSVTSVAGGGALHIYNQGAGITSLVAAANGGSIRSGSVNLETMELLPGDTVTLVRVPGDGVWYALHGSVANRYSGAMRGAVWDTPPQFDASRKLATTEFVQRALGNQAGAPVIVTGDTLLSASQVGLLFVTAVGSQFTLPPLAEVADGSCFHFLFNYDGASVKGNGSQVIQAGSSPRNVYYAGYAERLTLVKRSNAWYVAGGGIGVDGYLNSKSPNGWRKDPVGIIEQWGSSIINIPDGVSVAADVAFNIAFPNACWNFECSLGIYAASGSGYTTTRQGVSFGNPTKTGCWGRVFNDSGAGAAASTRLLFWRAIGN